MTAAHQIVLHPAVTNTLRVWATTVGRDKTYRAIQYFARFLAWYSLRKAYPKETVNRLNNLKSTLGLSRKLMRVGKFAEHFQAALKAADMKDPILRVTTIGRQLGYAFYLIHDSLAWAHSVKVKTFEAETIAKINKRAAQFWFMGLAFSIVSEMHIMRGIQFRHSKAIKPRSSPDKEAERKSELRTLVQQRSAIRHQLVQDTLDILIPSTTLGYLSLNDGVLGLAGTVTSVMGLRAQAEKVLSK